jgi:ubiquinone/menaquinone biosynthesis C-methylase UbiE
MVYIVAAKGNHMNKTIHRDSENTTNIFDHRTLETDYTTLVPVLREGLRVLDVGCGTGAISKGIALRVGATGHVVGIDNTERFIRHGNEALSDMGNLSLIYADLFTFQPDEEFDLVVAARVLQWLSNPLDAVKKLASFLKPGGQLSILDYNHEALEWMPQSPDSMRKFFQAFLQWRADAGMDNRIAEHLGDFFKQAGMNAIEVFNADEHYMKGQHNFIQRAGIWSTVAGLNQISDEGYIDDESRVQAITDYNAWIENDAEHMIMKLSEVRGRRP